MLYFVFGLVYIYWVVFKKYMVKLYLNSKKLGSYIWEKKKKKPIVLKKLFINKFS
jgi:hypothetical protein